MSFQNPLAFLFLLFIPLVFILRNAKIFSPISFPTTFADWNGSSFEWNAKFRNFARYLMRACFMAGFVSCVIGFADPVVYASEKIFTSRGADIMFVLDTSPSMAAKDIRTTNENAKRAIDETRFVAAKNAIHTLVENTQGASFGLVAMASEAALLVPPTLDKTFFFTSLDSLALGELGEGTAIGSGLSTAVYHLSPSNAEKKCIILVTDGENNAGSIHPETAADLAKNHSIVLYALAIGTHGKAPIDYVEKKTGKVYSGYLQSDFDPETLRTISAIANGRTYNASNASDLKNTLQAIVRSATVSQTYYIKNSETSYYRSFLFLGGLLFILSWIVTKLYLQELL